MIRHPGVCERCKKLKARIHYCMLVRPTEGLLTLSIRVGVIAKMTPHVPPAQSGT